MTKYSAELNRTTRRTSREMLIFGAAAYRLNGYKYIKSNTGIKRSKDKLSNLELMRTLMDSTNFAPKEEDAKMAALIRDHINGYTPKSVNGQISSFIDDLLKVLNQKYPFRSDEWKFAYMPEQYSLEISSGKVSEESKEEKKETENTPLGKTGQKVRLSITIVDRPQYSQYSAITPTGVTVKFGVKNPKTITILDDSGECNIKANIKALEKDDNGLPYVLLAQVVPV